MAQYGFDLVEEWDSVTARRLWVLIQGLPPDAAVWREEARWTQQDEFSAALLELTDIASRRIVQSFGGKVPGKPIHIDRPGEKVEADPADLGQFFREMKPRKGVKKK